MNRTSYLSLKEVSAKLRDLVKKGEALDMLTHVVPLTSRAQAVWKRYKQVMTENHNWR